VKRKNGFRFNNDKTEKKGLSITINPLKKIFTGPMLAFYAPSYFTLSASDIFERSKRANNSLPPLFEIVLFCEKQSQGKKSITLVLSPLKGGPFSMRESTSAQK